MSPSEKSSAVHNRYKAPLEHQFLSHFPYHFPLVQLALNGPRLVASSVPLQQSFASGWAEFRDGSQFWDKLCFRGKQCLSK